MAGVITITTCCYRRCITYSSLRYPTPESAERGSACIDPMRHGSDRSYDTWARLQIAESVEAFMRWIDSASAAGTCQLAKLLIGPYLPTQSSLIHQTGKDGDAATVAHAKRRGDAFLELKLDTLRDQKV
jgi:hypothetical protein